MPLARRVPQPNTFHAPLLLRRPQDVRRHWLVKGLIVLGVLLIIVYVMLMELRPEWGLPSASISIGEREPTRINLTGLLGWLSVVSLMVLLKLYHDRDQGQLYLSERAIHVARRGQIRLGYSLHQVCDIRLELRRPIRTWTEDSYAIRRIGHYSTQNLIRFTFVNERLERHAVYYHFRLYGEKEWQQLQWLLLCWQLHKVPYVLG